MKNALDKDCKKIYVGIRKSDIAFSGDYFFKDFCLFYPQARNDIAKRPNQNVKQETLQELLNKKTAEQCFTEPKCRFVFYNPSSVDKYPKEVQDRALFLNPHHLLETFNSKLLLKEWFISHELPIVPCETVFGKDLICQKSAKAFPYAHPIVVQSAHGGGGRGTFLMDENNYQDLLGSLNPLQKYLVSPYCQHSISVNIHVFISKSQIVLSPGSVQIVELHDHQLFYRGGDFVAFQTLPKPIKDQVKAFGEKVAKYMQKDGYCGIAGVDFLIHKMETVICMEINPRFQASTILLDQFLSQKSCRDEASSSYEINEMAFQDNIHTSLCFEDIINTSCYYYYNDAPYQPEKFQKKKKVLEENNLTVFSDGIEDYFQKGIFDNNSYMFRVIFPHPICGVDPNGGLWINDNISIQNPPSNTVELKIALLNQGVRLEGNDTLTKKGVYESIDIKTISNPPLYINCAYRIHLSQYSPFIIRESDEGQTLCFNDIPILPIHVEKDRLIDFSEIDRKILYLATDRLRIKIVGGCENKTRGLGCKFCNLSELNQRFTLDEIVSSLKHLKTRSDISFRHILIGGGTSLDNESWELILDVCHFLKHDPFYQRKPISLMSILPPDDMLYRLKKAGVEEVAFNLEVSNETLAFSLMPGKRRFGKEAYYKTFKKAVEIFGIGNVRSALLVGLDKEKDLYYEIVSLAQNNVVPCLSALRCLPNSFLSNHIGPSNEYLLKTYEQATALLKTCLGPIDRIGPMCEACGNNMLIVPDRAIACLDLLLGRS